MFGGLTDIPRISSYEQALELCESIKPIRGKGVNAGVKPLCCTPNGRRKTQYSIRKKKHPAAASKQAVECVLYTTPVITFVEDGTIYIDMSYPSMTTHAFVSEILNDFQVYCSYRDGQTWLYCSGKYWWIPNGHGVTFKVVGDAIEPVRPRLMNRYVVNRSKAKEVYARYAAFTSHCVAISKVADPQQMRGYMKHTFSTDFSLLQTTEPNEEWVQEGFHSIGSAVVSNYEWENHNIKTVYSLDPKRVRQVILDKLKREHYQEIFEVVKAEVGVYAKCLNEEYIR